MTDPTQAEEEKALARSIIQLSYGVWLQELQKKDRWFAQIVWVVLLGCSGALLTTSKSHYEFSPYSQFLIVFVGLLFISMNAEFLATRILGYLQVSRTVAAIRKSLGLNSLLKLDPTIFRSGSPLLSDDPSAFKRTALIKSYTGFRNIFSIHLIAIATLYLILPLFVTIHSATELAILSFVGLSHFLAFSLLFRYKVSEAENLGEFLVTLGREYNIGIPPRAEAEKIFKSWIDSKNQDLAQTSSEALSAIISFEDKRFHSHPGVDFVSLISVLIRKRKVGGATTIPMQLARQLISNPHRPGKFRTIKRKVFECLLGIYLVQSMGRKRLLTRWLTTIPFGTPRIIGIEVDPKSRTVC